MINRVKKLFIKGPENLTDTELIALLFGTGTKVKDVMQISEVFIKKFTLSKLADIFLDQLFRITGIGKGKLARIFAMLE